MVRWLRISIFFAALLLFTAAQAADSAKNIFSEELDSELYDCTLAVTPDKTATASSAIRLDLEKGNGKRYIRVAVTKQRITVYSMNGNRKTVSGQCDCLLPGDVTSKLAVLRRGATLALSFNGSILYRGDVPRAPGAQGQLEADNGWMVDGPRVLHLDPVAFSDNFMRTADANEAGNWTIQRGEWALQSAWDRDPKGNAHRFDNIIYSQNPFAWAGRSAAGASALCTVGKAFWEDYTFTVAVRPGVESAAGVMVNMADATHGYLIRWSPANDHSAQGDRIVLCSIDGDKTTVVAEDRGGYIPEQWYRLSVSSSLDGLKVLVDGCPRLSLKAVAPWRGGIGLYTEGVNGAVFNDVTVYGHSLKTDLLTESQQRHINQRYQDDKNGMQEWAARSDWTAFPSSPTQLLYRCDVYGDHWLVLTVRPFAGKTGELWMALNGDGTDPVSGYRAVIKRYDDKLSYTLFRGSTQLASKTSKPLGTTSDYTFRFWHTGKRIWLDQDGEMVLEANNIQPLSGLRPSYRADGCFALAHDVMVLGHNILDYTFADAPMDWLEQGTWMETTRWSCAPHWSFLAGWSRGDVVLWQKKRADGDQSFEAFVGPKMEYPREHDIYDYHYRDFGITICSDGHNPRSGYAGIYGAPDTTGEKNNQRTILLRNGVEVATADLSVPGRGVAHRMWFDLDLRKKGAVIEFWVGGKKVLSYTDPAPIAGGVPAIWSTNNGMSIAMAQWHSAESPQPRLEPQVILDNPWYPEWANINMPLKLNYPDSWATNGKPVILQTKTHLAPEGETSTVTVKEKTVTFTPTKLGEFWYEINATDSAVQSPGFHLFGRAFNPALGRDDSHAIVLYRFEEGSGEVVHDQSKVSPPANMTVLKDNNANGMPFWVPGQGLTVRGVNPLITAHGVPKLMAIAKARACTLEFWVSTDTIYPATGWAGCLLSWEMKTEERNFAVGHITTNMAFASRNAPIASGDANVFLGAGFRTSLQHYVLTWDGTTTRWYLNGVMVVEKKLEWPTDQWSPDYALFLGNQADLGRNYLGTYYLVAVHDRCLNDADVLRHYQAGPSAKNTGAPKLK